MKKEEKEKAASEFWALYDEYLSDNGRASQTEKQASMERLSVLLAMIESKDRANQLCRPEKSWDKIVGWQILRDQDFYFSGRTPLTLQAGEMIVWEQRKDNDVDILVTRIPRREIPYGRILKPGFNMNYRDRGDRSDWEWSQLVAEVGVTDERGLYLPIFERSLFARLCEERLGEAYQDMMRYLCGPVMA